MFGKNRIMNQPKRLFDCIETQLQRFPKSDMMASKVNGSWVTYSTEKVRDIVNEFSAGLIELGIKSDDRSDEGTDKIAIISNNRPEWIFTDLAVQQIGGVLVPLYPTTNPLEVKFILNQAKVKYIFVSSSEIAEKVLSIKDEVPTLQNIFSFDEIEGIDHWTKVTKMANEKSLSKAEEIKNKITEDDLATIIYTSGTTGVPKGVMLTHKNILSDIFYTKETFPFPDKPNFKVLSFLPLNHIFEKCTSYIYFYSGMGIYFAESLEKIGENIREVKPSFFATVPRLLEKVYEKIMAKGEELEGIKRKLFFWAVNLGSKYDNNINRGFIYNFQLAIANKLIFQKWRDALGGNIYAIVTGGAAAQEKLLRIFNAAKIPLYEGYGPTENSPVISVNCQTPGNSKYGTVGIPIKGIEVKLEPDGEICVKGPTVMKGYYLRPDLTAETVIDGWLHTGDIGTWVDNKFLKITDRKKELFKTSGGKYVAPQPIENKLKECPFIEQVIVVGSERKFVGALIVPAFAYLETWLQKNGMGKLSKEEILSHPKVLELFKNEVEEKNQYFNHVEQIKKFELLPEEWGIETGEMTPKMSLKRKIIMEKYKDAIERIYH